MYMYRDACHIHPYMIKTGCIHIYVYTYVRYFIHTYIYGMYNIISLYIYIYRHYLCQL